jgi:hypothetical protein
MKRTVAVLAVTLLWGGVAHSAPIAGAAVHWYYDETDHLINLRLDNTSDKVITAFTLDLTVTTNDNRTSHSKWTRDFLNSVAYAASGGTPSGPGPIPVKGSYDEKIGVPPGFKDFNAVLVLVAFEDKTAFTTDKEVLQHLIDVRNANAAAIEKATELVNKHATTAEAQVAIKNWHDTYKATPHQKFEIQTGDLEGIIEDLKQLPDKAAVENYLAAKNREAILWRDSAKLKEVTQ